MERILAVGTGAIVDRFVARRTHFRVLIIGVCLRSGFHNGRGRARAGTGIRIERCASRALAKAAVPGHSVVSIHVLTPGYAVRPCLSAETRSRHQFIAVGLQDQVAMSKDVFLLSIAELQQ